MKILYGICGIGNGHIFRQLPLITQLINKNHQVVIFAYDLSLKYFKKKFECYKNVNIVEVAVPFYLGENDGLNFSQSSKLLVNNKKFFEVNCKAMDFAKQKIGKPDYVISDYEPISAQYAYAYQSPLITIDQQSKYLFGHFPEQLNQITCVDEIFRLNMFFPKAKKRIITSFFNWDIKLKDQEEISIVAPVIREEVKALKGNKETDEILVYCSPQMFAEKQINEWCELFQHWPSFHFHLFLPQKIKSNQLKNVTYYAHKDPQFELLLARCKGIISTAGHGLISEAMYLEKPVLALPLPLYEQQMNAQILHENGFGLKVDVVHIDQNQINCFMKNLKHYKLAIKNDQKVLMRGCGVNLILHQIETIYV